MRSKFVHFGLAALFTASTAGLSFAADYDHEAKVKDMTFAWSVADKNLNVKISGKTTGWVGIGFNPTEQMKGANYILGYVKKGKPKVRDDYGDSARNHKSDKKLGGTSDVTLVAGEEKGGSTTIEFTIPLNSSDKYDSVIDPNGETVVLLAYGSGRDSFTSKHKVRASIKVNLASGKVEQ